MTLILGIFIGATIGYITAALMAAPRYSENPNNSSAKEDLAVQEEETEIGRAIERIEDMKKGIYLVYPESLYDFIIKTLQKHQKIEQIVSAWKADTWTDRVSFDCMMKINEVLEDGNDD